jgi:PAS domain S-box-containing protein
LVLVGRLVFFGAIPDAAIEQLECLAFPPLLWAIFRFDLRGAAASVFVISAFAFWSTLHGMGPFATPDLNKSLLLFQSFTAIISVIGLVLAAVIAERKQVETAMSASEERYRLVVEDQTEAISRFTADGTFTYANDVYCRLFSKTKHELIGSKWHPRAAKEDLPIIEAQLRTLSPANPVVVIENRIFNGAGEVRWFQFVNRAFFDEAGALVETQSVGRDITGRVAAEERIRQSEERFRLMFETMLQGVVYHDAMGKIISMNPAAERILGLTMDEFLGQTSMGHENYTRREDGSPFPGMEHPAMVALQTGRKVQDIVMGVYNLREKNYRWISISAVPVFRPGEDKPCQVYTLFDDITERRQMEEAFRHSQERYRSLAESSPDAIFILDQASTIQYVNRAGAQWLGRPFAELLGRSRADFFPPDAARRQQESLQRVFETGEMLQIERAQPFDGGEKWIETRLIPLRDKAGKVLFVMGISRDLTERRLAEVKLREAQKMLAAICDGSVDVIFIKDIQGRYLLFNQAAAKLVGKKPEEVVGKDDHYIFPAFEAKAITDVDRKVMESRQVITYEETITTTDGMVTYLSSKGPVFNDEGQVSGLFGISRDITQRKRAEMFLKELATIVQSSEDAIISITLEEIIISWNKAAERLLGYTAGEMIGKNALIIVPPEQLEQARQIIRRVTLGESVESYETVRRHKDGTLRDLSVKVSGLTDADGKIISISVIYRDITARKQLEKTVLEISANERRRVGHELHDGLGQYLAGIAFKAKVLEGDLAAESSRLARDAEKIVGLINDAIQQTRNLARGLDPVDFEVSGLPAALQDLAAQTENLFHIDCIFRCNEERLDLDTQTNITLYRITQEAINNAIKHGQARRIEIDLKAGKPQLSLTIRDHGKGFLPDDILRRGMGLRIMGYRASTVGGVLSVHSEVDVGTEIKCLLPGV